MQYSRICASMIVSRGTAGLLALFFLGCPPPAPVERAASVQGYLAWPFKPSTAERIYVPGVTTRLESLESGQSAETTRTDLSGRFYFPPQAPGDYRLCWEAEGFVAECHPEIISIVGSSIYLNTLELQIEPSTEVGTIWGRVHFADGSVPRTLEPLVNVNSFATVHAVDASGEALISPVYVNNFGDYLAPRVPATELELRVQVEDLVHVMPLAAGDIPGATPHQIAVELPNRRPNIEEAFAVNPAGGHWTARPGDRLDLRVRASDGDGEALDYYWLLPDGKKAVGANTTYDVPENTAAKMTFTAFAHDRKGGYAKGSFTVTLGKVRFTGTVEANDAPLVAGAEVDVNGETTTTDADGYFAISVPESSRYVLNISKTGYRLVSNIYDGALGGGRWMMHRASVSVENPARDIKVEQAREPIDCLGPWTARSNLEAHLARFPTEFQDGRGGRLDRPPSGALPPGYTSRRKCGPGIRVRIPAGSLVQEDGTPPPPGTMVNVAVSTVDLEAPDAMPGDYTARSSSGATRVMQSFGAGSIEVYDDDGGRYSLADDASATVSLPVPEARLDTAPQTIPVLYYDRKDGIWRQEPGLVARLTGGRYEVAVRHFSELNADVLKDNQSCVRIDSIIMPPTYFLQVTIPDPGGGEPTTVFRQVDNANRRFHVLYNLPSDTVITLTALDTDGSIEEPVQGAVIQTASVNTGGPQDPLSPNKPEFPYSACKATVELRYQGIPGSAQNQFLSGITVFAGEFSELVEQNILALQAQNIDEDDVLVNDIALRTANYYGTVDPFARRTTLEEFIEVNGFETETEVTALYSNSGDLGFGRDMHCAQNGEDIACYVTNYGDQDSDDLEDFRQMLRYLDSEQFEDAPVATVAMEYSPVETGYDAENDSYTYRTDPDGEVVRIVKFFVYAFGLQSFDRVSSADLDGFGQRPVPELCMMCHGGRPNGEYLAPTISADGEITDPGNPLSGDLGSSFLHFDLAALTLPELADDNGDPIDHKETQQQAFYDLNQLVKASQPTAAIRNVIDAMYDDDSPPQNEETVVTTWGSEDQEVYTQVVGRSCRACHAATGASTDEEFYLWWDDRDKFEDSGPRHDELVCQKHAMPHALITYKNFWLSTGQAPDPPASGHQPLLLHNFLRGSDDPDTVGQGGGSDCVNVVTPPAP